MLLFSFLFMKIQIFHLFKAFFEKFLALTSRLNLPSLVRSYV